MLKVKFVQPDPTETPEQICEHNLRIADTHYQLTYFIASSMAWFKLRPGNSFQDLETYLRTNGFSTYLIAKKYEIMPVGTKFIHPPGMSTNTDTKIDFECIYSCRPTPHALNELIETSGTYEENFQKLGLAGMLGVDTADDLNANTIPGDHLKKFSPTETNTVADISDCKIKIKFEELSVDDFVADLTASCEEKYQTMPTMKLVGMGPNGEAIMGFFIHESLVCGHGIMMSNAGNIQQKKLIRIA